MKKLIAIAAVVLAVAAAEANPYVVLQGGRRIEGVTIRARADRTVILTTAQGQEFTFTSDQYVQAVAARPPEFDEGMRLLQAGRHDDAIARFRQVVERNRFLSWDEQALVGMARAHEGKNDAQGALQAYETLIQTNPRREADRDIRWGYYRAMQGAGRVATLRPKLEEIIREGERADAARAYLMRGRIHAGENQLEEAVLDFLRTVMFFRREGADVMPEAYLNVAETLEKMRDNRSREWYRNLIEEFPNSPQAAAARAKL